MVEVREKQTDWKGILKEIFGGINKKDIDNQYFKWEQENRDEIKSSNNHIAKLISEIESSKNISGGKKQSKKILPTISEDRNTSSVKTKNKEMAANKSKKGIEIEQ